MHSYAQSKLIKNIEIDGVSGDLKNNVSLYLKQLVGEKPNPTVRRYAQQQVLESVKALGYYNADVEVNYERDSNDLIVNINLGPATHIKAVNIKINGDAKNDEAILNVIKDIKIKQGDVLNHGAYESAHKKIASQLLNLGYFDANWPTRELAISVKNNTADVTFVIDSGVRYAFGEINIASDTPADAYIRSISPFSKAQPYKATLISDYNLALSSMPYFSSVRVYADIAARKNGQVPVELDVVHKPDNSFEIGGGFNTDLGPKVRFKWTKPWITQDGHFLESNLNISQKQQDISMSYTVPVDDPNNDLWRLNGGYKLEDELTEGVYSEILTAQLQRQWLTQDNWVRTAFIRRDEEVYRIGDDEEQNTEMLMPGISYARKQAKGGATPYEGEQWLVSAEFGLDDVFSSTNILRVQLKYAWLNTYAQRHMFFAKASLGAMLVNDISNVPYSLRFYAGGDQSVRGFAYQSISPKDDDGDAIGGKYMFTNTLEYNYQFATNWRAALFIDSGTATNDFSDDYEVGAGFGLRYITPVGPVRIDHAWGVTKESKSTRLSITIGPEI
ncbi:outer membrane protein assembly factor [Pseudoalteromonas sp. MMG010]|uniref:autotransporter assembly complex protein TamA n=1 Tax=Pseudoalteromonas sp. MMG010 TaxID=2822685 RepID=UPI001B3A292E|nr:autotransporter assembly complex family protein [Pseudoalteromonas sp. MMG010]MBQ4831661.1 outer membrane protein assembly factor [Pseudoalteromonas sp. MMG010]